MYRDTADVYFMQTSGEFMGARYANLESFPDLMRFPKKLLESIVPVANNERMALHAFMA